MKLKVATLTLEFFLTSALSTFPLAAIAGGGEPAKATPVASFRESQALFDSFNNNSPVFHQAMLNMRLSLLRAQTDAAYSSILEQNPLLTPHLRKLIEETTAEMVEARIQRNLLSMKRITAENASERDVYEATLLAAKAQGLTDEEIKNMDIFIAMGPVNAYTFAGKNNRKVVVIFDGLIDKLRDKNGQLMKVELAGVVGHELGHVINGHINQSLLSSIMLTQLFNLFTAKPEQAIADSDSSLDAQTSKVRNQLQDYALHSDLDGSFESVNEGVSQSNSSNSVYTSLSNVRRDAMGQAMKLMTERVAQLRMQNPQALVQVMSQFLSGVIQILSKEAVPPELLKSFMVLGGNLSNLDVLPRFNPQDLMVTLMALMDTVSRGNEASADVAGWLVGPGDRIGKVDAIFAGARFKQTLDNPGPYRQEIRQTYQDLLNQVKDFYNRATPAQRAAVVGLGSGNHPMSAFRLVNAMEASRQPDIAGFKDPLVRTILTRAQMINDVASFQAEVADFDSRSAEMKKKLSAADYGHVESYIKNGKKVVLEIQKLIDQSGARIIEHVSGSTVSDAAKVARLRRIVDFSLARKTGIITSLNVLTEVAASAKDEPQRVAQIQEQMSFIGKQSKVGDDLLSEIGKHLNSATKTQAGLNQTGSSADKMRAQVDRINHVLAADLTLEQANELRIQIATERHAANGRRWTTITSDSVQVLGVIPTDGSRFEPAAPAQPTATQKTGVEDGAQTGSGLLNELKIQGALRCTQVIGNSK